MSAQRFTVEEIEAAAMLHKKYVNDAKAFGATVTLVTEHAHAAAMLRAFALQTRQVEQMREFLDESPNIIQRAREQFALLFPKDGGQ